MENRIRSKVNMKQLLLGVGLFTLGIYFGAVLSQTLPLFHWIGITLFLIGIFFGITSEKTVERKT